MPGLWEIIVPEATTNLISNPSFETNTTGWTLTTAGSLARSASNQRFGANSLAVTPASGSNDGVYFGTVALVSGTTYTFSVYVLGASGVPYQLYVASTAGSLVGSAATFTGTGAWQRVSVSYTETSTNSRRLYVTKNSSSSTAVFYLDGAQCEAKSYVTTYCDGEQAGCSWSGTRHASAASRLASSAAGGRVRNLSDDYGLYITGIADAGVPPITNVSLPYGNVDGALFQQSLATPRTLNLQGTLSGSSLTHLHSVRKALFDLLKPDRVPVQQPVVLRYLANPEVTQIKAVYDAGLGIGQLAGFSENIGLRLIAHDPYWFSEADSGASLAVQNSVANANFIIRRDANGVWSAMANGLRFLAGAMSVFSLAIGPDGTPYAGGSYTTSKALVRWDGSAWQDMGAVVPSTAIVYALAFGPDGALYAGGSFTSIGGVSANYVAKWDGSTWTALGTGMGGGTPTVSALAVGTDGSLYAAGSFTTAGGSSANRIAKWNGSSWSALGSGLNAAVTSLAVGKDGNLYVAGQFSTAGGSSASYIARWDGSAWSALGSGCNAQVNALAVGDDGTIYAAGGFTTAGGVSVNKIARWNGVAWQPLGAGVSGGDVSSLAYAEGVLYAGGYFTSAGGIALPDRVAIWNGTAWLPLEVDLPSSSYVPAVAVQNGNLYMLFDGEGTAIAAANTTVTNSGTANAYPRITFTGPGRIYQFKNVTTGEAIFCNLVLNTGETATLDLSPGNKTFSSTFRGNVIGSILPGSNINTWRLAPGTNALSVLMGNSSATVTLAWRKRFWSADGGAA